MSLSINNAVTNQRVRWTAPVDAGTLAFCLSAWVYVNDRTLTGQRLFSIKSSATAVGLMCGISNQVPFFYRETTTTGLFYAGVEGTASITANATWYHVVMQHRGDGAAGTTSWKIWVNGAAVSLTDVGNSSGTLLSLSGGTFDWGNASDLGASTAYRGRIRDTAVWTHTQGTDILTQAEVTSLYAGGAGMPPKFLTPASGATLRHAPAFANFGGGTGQYDSVIDALATKDGSPVGPTTPDAATPSLTAGASYFSTPVDVTNIMAVFDCRKWVDATTAGRAINWYDLSGHGEVLYHENGYTSASKPGFINSGADLHVCCDNPSSAGTLFSTNAPSTFSNGNFACSFIMAKNGTNNGARLMEATTPNNLTIKTNDSGFLQVRMNSTDHTCTKARPSANMCEVGISVSQTNSSSAKTILVFIDGQYVETLTTAAFAEVTTNRLGLFGPSSSLGATTTGNYQIWKQILWYSATKTQGEMETLARAQCSEFGVPTSRSGTVILHGSSTMSAGAFATFNRDWAYLCNWGRARVFNVARANTRLATHAFAVSTSTGGANATAFDDGETITQTGTGDTFQFVAESGNLVFCNLLTGTGVDAAQNLNGATAIRDPSSSSISTNGGQTASVFIDVVDTIIQDTNYAGPVLLLWQVGANDIPGGIDATATANAYLATVAQRPSPGGGRTLYQIPVSPHPRDSGANLATVVTVLRSAANVGTVARFADYTVNAAFNDFASSSDYGNTTYYNADTIHLNITGYRTAAPYLNGSVSGLLGVGGGIPASLLLHLLEND